MSITVMFKLDLIFCGRITDNLRLHFWCQRQCFITSINRVRFKEAMPMNIGRDIS